MKKQTWVFYFCTHKNPMSKEYDAFIDCVYPNRTRRWKMLQRDLQNNDVHSVGYMLASDFIKEREELPICSVEREILNFLKNHSSN